MTYYAATMEMPAALARYPQASSAAAGSVERQVHDALTHYRAPRAGQIALQVLNLLEPEEAQDSVDLDTVQVALDFAKLLPRSLPAPEIAADPDGEVSFDWLGPAGKMFSVSVSRAGRIAYAGRFGSTSKIHGTEQLSETLAQEIVRGIQRAVR